jgi:hypothetical protein
MNYARVHDQTVADDYYTAMERVEQRLELVSALEKIGAQLHESERVQLLGLAMQLQQSEMSVETRLEIAAQMYFLLTGRKIALEKAPINDYGRKQWEYPPPSPVLLGVG